MMPGMDGYVVCGRLKADPKLSDIPVIFLSALNDVMDKVKAFQMGGIDYIAKPFQIEEVRARIETHLKLRRQRRLLEENYEKLRQLESLRDNLVHMIVHDMRTPLTIIHGVHEILEKFDGGNLSSDGAQRLKVAMRRTEDLIELVNSLLDVSKLESGKMQLKKKEFDIVRLIQKVASSTADASPKHIITPILPETEVEIFGDEVIIGRIIHNIITNAIKYSPEGTEIRIEIQFTDSAIRVSIQDQGPGILPEYHSKIFDKFFQIENRKNSTGLGLTFCKLAVEAHGGDIGVESKVGIGSTFWFVLPKKALQ
jgi:two-component system, sensor histidine kinase and response regulator